MYFVAIKMGRRQGSGSAGRRIGVSASGDLKMLFDTPARRSADTFRLAASLQNDAA